jgi:hypothetical protein
MANIPFLLPNEMLEVIAQANPETTEAFVDANIQEPQLNAIATEWADMFQKSMNNIIPLGLAWRWGAHCSQNEIVPGAICLGVWLMTQLPPGFCSQLVPRVECWAGSLGILCSRLLHEACSSWRWAFRLSRGTQDRPGLNI